jgi:hypothetical protein
MATVLPSIFVGIASVAAATAETMPGPVVVAKIGVEVVAAIQPRAAFSLVRCRMEVASSPQVQVNQTVRVSAKIRLRTEEQINYIREVVSVPVFGLSTFGLQAKFYVPSQGMNLSDVGRQIYNLWGLEITSTKATTFARARVVEIINAAMQTIYGRAVALDYFNRTTTTIQFAAGENAKALPAAMQTLLGPVRFASSKQSLRPATTRGEFDEFVNLYYGGKQPALPRMYFLERGFADASDSAGVTLLLSPAPTEETALEVEYAQEAPRYTESDLISGVPLRIPHRYVESILLPIAKHVAASDRMFTKEGLRATLQADYNRAMQQLGLVDPEPVAVRNTKPKEGTA